MERSVIKLVNIKENILEMSVAMSNIINRNTEGLKKHANKKSILAKEKVDNAIQRLIKNHETINFNTVSIEANVTKAYLYNNKEIRARIEKLREQQGGSIKKQTSKANMTESSKDILIASKNKRLKLLEEENQLLKDQVMDLRGKIYDNF